MDGTRNENLTLLAIGLLSRTRAGERAQEKTSMQARKAINANHTFSDSEILKINGRNNSSIVTSQPGSDPTQPEQLRNILP